MRVLVIHQNFPGQFGHLVETWSKRPGWEVRGLGRDTAPGLPGFDGLIRYALHRRLAPGQHAYLRQMELATLHGQAVARELLRLRTAGFTPDAILAHPGWGETLYAKDVFPQARLVHYCEWFYAADRADLGFDPEFPVSFDDRARVRTWNALHTLNLVTCDAAVAPTEWQKSRHPAALRSKIVVQHEGIDLDRPGPDREAALRIANGLVLRAGDPVITFVARNLEPYRGFHVFMRALERVQRHHPDCHAVVVGGDEVSYGRRPPAGSACWRDHMLARLDLDLSRIHFTGRIPRETYLQVLRVSAAHVYLTYPFVLSWSLLEAMACAAPIVASDTAPVREVITNGIEGRLTDFFDATALSDAMLDMLGHPQRAQAFGAAARERAKAFSRAQALAVYDRLIGAVEFRQTQPPPRIEAAA